MGWTWLMPTSVLDCLGPCRASACIESTFWDASSTWHLHIYNNNRKKNINASIVLVWRHSSVCKPCHSDSVNYPFKVSTHDRVGTNNIVCWHKKHSQKICPKAEWSSCFHTICVDVMVQQNVRMRKYITSDTSLVATVEHKSLSLLFGISSHSYISWLFQQHRGSYLLCVAVLSQGWSVFVSWFVNVEHLKTPCSFSSNCRTRLRVCSQVCGSEK